MLVVLVAFAAAASASALVVLVGWKACETFGAALVAVHAAANRGQALRHEVDVLEEVGLLLVGQSAAAIARGRLAGALAAVLVARIPVRNETTALAIDPFG